MAILFPTCAELLPVSTCTTTIKCGTGYKKAKIMAIGSYHTCQNSFISIAYELDSSSSRVQKYGNTDKGAHRFFCSSDVVAVSGRGLVFGFLELSQKKNKWSTCSGECQFSHANGAGEWKANEMTTLHEEHLLSLCLFMTIYLSQKATCTVGTLWTVLSSQVPL